MNPLKRKQFGILSVFPVSAFIAFAFLGKYMLSLLAHKGTTLKGGGIRVLCISTDGIFGVPIGISVHYFIFFFGCISTITPPVALSANGENVLPFIEEHEKSTVSAQFKNRFLVACLFARAILGTGKAAERITARIIRRAIRRIVLNKNKA